MRTALRDQSATFISRVGRQIDDPVAARGDAHVVLDDDDRVP
jgi:hypothetical protein